MKVSCPALLTFRSAFLNAGYKVSISHCNPRAIKSDAPVTFFWAVMKKWVEDSGVLALDQLPEDSISKRIMTSSFDHKVSFDKHPDANPPSRKSGLCRFQENPTANWGPMAKAKSAKITKD